MEGYKTAYPDTYGTLKQYAKTNRQFPTRAESILWNALRKHMPEIRFRRQHIIGDYIADFACLKHKLIIEVDGEYHNTCEQRDKDMARTQTLEHWGFRVLRFSNDDVTTKRQQTIDKIKKVINNQ